MPCVLVQYCFTYLDPQPRAAEQRSHASMSEHNAVPADIIREQETGVGSFDEIHVFEMCGQVPARG